MPPSDVSPQKSVAVTHGGSTTAYRAELRPNLANPLDVYFGDTINYRLQVQMGNYMVDNLKVYDVLPAAGVNNTAWDSDIINLMKLNSGVNITISDGVTTTPVAIGSGPGDATLYYYSDAVVGNTLAQTITGTLLPGYDADAKSIVVDFGAREIPAKSIVTIEFSIKLVEPGSTEYGAATPTTPDHAALLAANALKIAHNSVSYLGKQWITSGATPISTNIGFSSTNTVTVRLLPEAAVIGGLVWQDRNINGLQGDAAATAPTVASENDAPDIPLSGAAVTLRKYVDGAEVFPVSGAVFWAQTLTGADGRYSFTGLESSYGTSGSAIGSATGAAITYRVDVATPAGLYFTVQDAGTQPADDIIDSDVDAGGRSPYFYLKPTSVSAITAIDAGVYGKSTISGFTWEDRDDDGIKSASDPLLGGIGVTLIRNGTPVPNAVATTSALDGHFAFTGMEIPYGTTDVFTLEFDKSAIDTSTYTHEWALKDQGTDDGLDSDVFPITASGSTTPDTDRSVNYALSTAPAINPGYATTSALNTAAVVPKGKFISGYVWEDTDVDGLYLTGEPTDTAINNAITPGSVTVNLYDAAAPTALIATTQTRADGTYRFVGVPHGTGGDLVLDATHTYIVEFELPAGGNWTFTDKDAGTQPADDVMDSDVNVAPVKGRTDPVQVSATNVDAGMIRTTSISGQVWRDENGDGTKQSSEIGYDPSTGATVVTLYRYDDATSTWAAVPGKTASVTLGGIYSFDALRPGEYYVDFDRSAVSSTVESYTWSINPPAPANVDNDAVATGGDVTLMTATTAALSLVYNTPIADIDGGIVPTTNKIRGVVWDDRDYDGVRDAGEAPIAGVKVALYNGSTKVDEKTTDSLGAYLFDGTNHRGVNYAGNPGYRVVFTNPDTDAWSWTLANQGGSDTVDSDAVYTTAVSDATARSHGIYLSDIGTAAADNVDAGLWKNSRISGFVWRDVDDDGIRDTSENGISGVTVTLTGTTSDTAVGVPVSVNKTATTASDGTYSFKGLKNGTYRVAFARVTQTGESSKWSLYQQGGNPAVDSDAVAPAPAQPLDRYAGSAQTQDIALPYGGTSARQSDAGIVPYVHISGVAWLDTNRNGVRNAGEAWFPNIKVQLYRKGKSAPVATATTDASGAYSFDELLLVSGTTTYKVAFTNPNAEDYSFTIKPKSSTNGTIRHTATDLKGSSKGDTKYNYHDEGHTAYVTVTAHHENKLNSGFYVIPAYKVTYLPNGGEGSWGTGSYTIWVKEGRLVPDQKVTRDGYTFEGWWLRPSEKSKWDFKKDLMPARDIVLRAHWEPVPEDDDDTTPPPVTPVVVTTPPPPDEDVEEEPDETTPPPPEVDEVEPPVIEEPPQETPKTPEDNTVEIVDIGPLGIPAGNGAARDVWSLLSLILSLIAFAFAAGTLIAAARRKQNDAEMWSADEDRERRRRRTRRVFRTLSVVIGCVPGIVWLLLDDLRLPMAWINHWTIYVAIAFIVFLICFIVFKIARRRKDNDDDRDRDGLTRDMALDALYTAEGWRVSDEDWYVNGENRRFRTLGILTIILAAIGAVFWIIFAQRGIPSMQLGGVLFLVCFGLPGLFAAAFDRDWFFLGDDDRPANNPAEQPKNTPV